MRKITREECEVTMNPEEEHIPVKGNALASGDNAADKVCEDELIERLNGGDIWAWFCAAVTVTYGPLTVTDYLGCCSYKDRADFETPGGYYDSMIDTCVDALNTQAAELLAKLT